MNLKTPYGEYRITQGFGERPNVYKIFGMNGHNGIDFVGMSRNYCIAEGDFVLSGFDAAGYGNYIKIRDAEGNEWTYAHFAEPVKARGHIKLWQDLGPMGKTGFATGAHLHITKKPKNPNNNNGFKGAIDFKDYLDTLNPTPNKKRMRITDTQRAVWMKEGNTAKIFVIIKHGKAPLETIHTVDTQKALVETVFGMNDAFKEVKWPEIAGLTKGEPYDINNTAITHPEYFELV